MLESPVPGSAPQSSSRPSTTRTSRRPAFTARSAACSSNWRRSRSRIAAGAADGTCSPVTAASWSSSSSVNAVLSAWVARGAVMKNEITQVPGGGCRTSQDISADLPARGPACHRTYPSSPPAHQLASSFSSSSRPSSCSGAMSPTSLM